MWPSNKGAPRARRCVLLVEDDRDIRRSVQLLLRADGFEVRAYASAGEALADSQARVADCLIADLVMPELNGIGFLSSLRARGWEGPSILISGYLTPTLEASARSAGFHHVLAKPLNDHALLNLVRKCIDPHSV